MDEDQLIKRIVKGETSLFQYLVERYKDISLSLAYSFVKTKEEAEDVVQDAFIKAFRNLRNFNYQSSFSTWFYRIVINTSYHSLEKSKIRRTIPIDNQLADSQTSQMNSHSHLNLDERQRIINTVLASLKTNEALLLRLSYLGEQSHREIAEITGLSQSNVKVILHRARKNFYLRLKKLMGNETDELL